MPYRIILILSALVVGTGAHLTAAQTASKPVRLTGIHGPRAVVQDSVANYRATASATSSRPIEYLWTFSDGVASEGVVVARKFQAPGVHTITVTASNAAGRDTLRTTVVVAQPRPKLPDRVTAKPAPKPVATERPTREAKETTSTNLTARARRVLYSDSSIQPASTGYTWIVASDLWRERLEATAVDYILKGLRVELYTDTSGKGSPAYRLITGHFTNVEEALAARPFLPEMVQHPVLLNLAEPR